MVDTTNVVVAGSGNNRSYVDWPAIIAGAVLATSISFILFTFGSAIGLGVVSPYRGSAVAPLTAIILSAVWVVFVAASSFMAGAYLTGRMRHRFNDSDERESNARDGMHGLIMWGLAVLIGAVLAAGSLASLARAGATVAAGAAAGAGAAASNQQAGSGAFDLVTDALFRPAANVTPPAPAQPGVGPSRGETRDEVDRMLARGISRGEIVTEDRKYVAQLVARETGMSEAEAEARVNTIIDKTIADAKRAADIARKTAIMVACLTATTLLVCGVGAFWAAVRGGDHRDNARDLGPMWS